MSPNTRIILDVCKAALNEQGYTKQSLAKQRKMAVNTLTEVRRQVRMSDSEAAMVMGNLLKGTNYGNSLN